MTDLDQALEAIGLEGYSQQFRCEGFDTWRQLMDVTESDLEALGVRLGHRRRLQRAIQDARRNSGEEPLRQPALHKETSDPSQGGSRSDGSDSRPDGECSQSHAHRPQASKRKYRRHPKPDENAPERPPSAYVLFSNRVRERLKGQDLSFTDIAKVVGKEWQNPNPEERAECEREAQARKEAYYAAMAEYKKTQNWADYQEYLVDFKAKHGDHNAQADSKRTRTGADHDNSTRSSSQERPYVDGSPMSDGITQDGYTSYNRSDGSDAYAASDTNTLIGHASWHGDPYSPALNRNGHRSTMSVNGHYFQEPTVHSAHSEKSWDSLSNGSRRDSQFGRHDALNGTNGMRAPLSLPLQRGGPVEFKTQSGSLSNYSSPTSPVDPRSRKLPIPAGFAGGQQNPDTFSAVRVPQHIYHGLPGQTTYRDAHMDLSLPPLNTSHDYAPRPHEGRSLT